MDRHQMRHDQQQIRTQDEGGAGDGEGEREREQGRGEKAFAATPLGMSESICGVAGESDVERSGEAEHPTRLRAPE